MTSSLITALLNVCHLPFCMRHLKEARKSNTNCNVLWLWNGVSALEKKNADTPFQTYKVLEYGDSCFLISRFSENQSYCTNFLSRFLLSFKINKLINYGTLDFDRPGRII